MKSFLFVFLGGGTGCVLRYLLSSVIVRQTEGAIFPWGTWVVNIAGCLAIGLFYALSQRLNVSVEVLLLLTVGLCGGFTTFSTFSNEGLQLLRSGLYLAFFVYTVSSVVLGIAAVMIGGWIGRSL